jgi:Tfp pilus assembly protein FimT
MTYYSHTRKPKVTAKRSVTAIEALTALSAVLVLVVLAAPSQNQPTAKSEMKSALEILESSIDNARHNARIYHTDVVLRVRTEHDETSTLSYSVHAPQSSEQAIDFQPKNYQIPTGVRLTADRETIRFDARGVVDPPAQLVLVSVADEGIREQILLQ